MITEFDKIDDLAVNAADHTKLHLFIFDHLEWDQKDVDVRTHLAFLQMKIENYLTFIKIKGYMNAFQTPTEFKSFEIVEYAAYDFPRQALRFQHEYQKKINRKKLPVTLAFEVHHLI